MPTQIPSLVQAGIATTAGGAIGAATGGLLSLAFPGTTPLAVGAGTAIGAGMALGEYGLLRGLYLRDRQEQIRRLRVEHQATLERLGEEYVRAMTIPGGLRLIRSQPVNDSHIIPESVPVALAVPDVMHMREQRSITRRTQNPMMVRR